MDVLINDQFGSIAAPRGGGGGKLQIMAQTIIGNESWIGEEVENSARK